MNKTEHALSNDNKVVFFSAFYYQLPSNVTCDDLLREMYVQKVIEEGLFDSKVCATKGNL